MSLMLFAVVFLWVVTGAGCWFGYQLFRQNGRMLLRIDALERRLREDKGALTFKPALPIGSVAPDFELRDLAGERRSLSQFRDQRVLLIFFNPQCGYCMKMAPALAALAPHGNDKQPMPLVVTTGGLELNRRFFQEHEIRCPVLLQDNSEISAHFQAHGTPTGYLIEKQGIVGSQLAMGEGALLSLCSDDERGAEIARKGNKSLADSRLNRSGLKTGVVAPGFRLPSLDGREISLQDYRGRRVLLVFSDPQCGPCDQLAPHLERLHRERRDVQVLMISRRDLETNLQKIRKLGLTFPVVLQKNWEVSLLYAMFATPIAYLIDEQGVTAADVAVGVQPILDLTTRSSGINHADVAALRQPNEQSVFPAGKVSTG
jgi:peroxiredoxin